MMGDLSGRVCQRGGAPPRYVLIRRSGMWARDALMVNGFDIIGQNRTLQIHWAKRVAAFALDCLVVLTPVWILLFLLGERRVPVYGVASGLAFFVYATVMEGIWRRTVGKTIAGLEVRAVGGPMTLGKAAVRNVPKLFWFLFPLLDTIAGLLVEGDPRQRFSDRILGTTVAQSSLIHVRLHRIETPQ
ncbi:MAG: RDD family protein [Methanobacteriota archaeon]|nr:MAG: RDD family protein [Euryarchaeota archaeon]